MGGDLALSLGGRRKICCRPNFLMTFFRKNFHFDAEISDDFFSVIISILSVFSLSLLSQI